MLAASVRYHTNGWDLIMLAGRWKAVVMDVDGTMYSQRPVRRHMVLRLAMFALRNPLPGLRTLRCLRAFRQAQEQLRGRKGMRSVAQCQIEEAARRSGYSADFITECVHRWMEKAPLEAIRRARYTGLLEFCEWARHAGLRMAVLSDYDPREKLRALEVEDYFPVIACAQDPDIGVLKPDPAGLRAVVGRLGVSPAETVYVGDRPEVDGAVAVAAGVTGVILHRKARAMPPHLIAVSGWPALPELFRRRDLAWSTGRQS
jgi:HAD superfamily hydrolase (TIGR01549 family)